MAPDLLHAALAEAAVREGSADWARALLRSGVDTGNRLAELLRTLPPQEWMAAVNALRERADMADLVGGLPTPWPAALGQAVLDHLAALSKLTGGARVGARLASIAARAVPPELLNHPITREPTGDEDTWRLRLVETLTFRRELYEELS